MPSSSYLDWAAWMGFAYVAALFLLILNTSKDWVASGYGRGRFNVRRDVYGRGWFALTSKTKRTSVIALRASAAALLVASFAFQVLGSRGL
ncbi:MAG: hypothetical protein DI570_17725 [Phenylobacterium zucineum]|nr:MAG: hypothetical protein DI570_17725 [Phenylobacterium zucineum]